MGDSDDSRPDDDALRAAVLRELELDPLVDATRIAVSVENGAVTLAGRVSGPTEKLAALRAVERVAGVLAVADELVVERPGKRAHDDAELAEEVAKELRWHVLVPDTVRAEVRRGVVVLRGEVEWFFQREEAERAVRRIEGVVGVDNEIVVRPRAKPDAAAVRRQVLETLERVSAEAAPHISVTASDGTLILHGRVHSEYERELAERVARSAPGYARVVNEIEVERERTL